MESFVLDSSLTLSWCFQDETTEQTEAVFRSLAQGTTAVVPPLWVWEVTNTLCLAERAKRITKADRSALLTRLQSLPIEIDTAALEETWLASSDLALSHSLTVYDAAYLRLAVRLCIPLGTLDRQLRKAAELLKVPLLPLNL